MSQCDSFNIGRVFSKRIASGYGSATAEVQVDAIYIDAAVIDIQNRMYRQIVSYNSYEK